jgi:hypothetical protein
LKRTEGRGADHPSAPGDFEGGSNMTLIIIIILVLLLVGAAPAWPHSRGWGYFPSGLLGIILLIVIILLLLGRL